MSHSPFSPKSGGVDLNAKVLSGDRPGNISPRIPYVHRQDLVRAADGFNAAVKLHTLLDLRGAIPSFIHISDGKLHDVNALDLLIPEPAAIYVMDRGYLDFDRLCMAIYCSSGHRKLI
jgi:hypothetical protein